MNTKIQVAKALKALGFTLYTVALLNVQSDAACGGDWGYVKIAMQEMEVNYIPERNNNVLPPCT